MATTIIANGELLNKHFNDACELQRSKLATETKKFHIPFELLRVHDAFQTNLPNTAASDDLGLILGTFGTDALTVRTSDSKNTSVTQYARFRFALPESYVAGGDISVCAWAGMKTTVANGTATIDFSVHATDKATGLVGSDLVTTSATTINSLTLAAKEFVVTPTALTNGDTLDIRVVIAITDSATGTAVIGQFTQLYLQLEVQG